MIPLHGKGYPVQIQRKRARIEQHKFSDWFNSMD